MKSKLRVVKMMFVCSIVLFSITVFNLKDKVISNANPANIHIKSITKDMSEELCTDWSEYKSYYGMLHSHTSYSDGQGNPIDAFKYAKTKAEKMDFFALTEHSQCFDNWKNATLADGSVSNEWNEIRKLANEMTTKDFLALYGYEMTWKASHSNGHINTFNTNGFVGGVSEKYDNNTTALKDYYSELLTVAPESFSQFNHPSVKWGHFKDFEYMSPEVDKIFSLVEMPGYHTCTDIVEYCKYYQRALDKGWHVSPANNQDNHKMDWGTVNTRRSIVLAKSLTKDEIYDSIKKNRTYSTEDLDLELKYTLDGYMSGSKVNVDRLGDKATILLTLKDPTDESIGKVEVVVNNGEVIYTKDVVEKELYVKIKVPTTYSMYYVRVKQNDGDMIVTAPVWVGYYKASTPIIKQTTEVTVIPTTEPTAEPTKQATSEPTTEPTVEPTKQATSEPTTEPTVEPTKQATNEPTIEPTVETTKVPSDEVTVRPTVFLEDKSVDMDSRPEEAIGDDSAEFTAKPQDIGTDEIYDDAPKTGDSSDLYGYIALAIILFISIIGESMIMIKYSRNNVSRK